MKAIKVLVLLAIISISAVGCGSVDETETKPTEPEKAETKSTAAEVKKEEPKEVKPKKKPKIIAEVELTSENITPILKKFNEDIDKVEVNNGNVVVSFDPEKTYWDETDIARETALDGVVIFEELFKNPETQTVQIIAPNTLIDDKGNETIEPLVTVKWDRALNNEINYKNFKDLVLVEFPRFYNVSKSYNIHPAVFTRIKEKYAQKFEGGFVKEE
jgi:hypothetical protein